MVMFLQTFLIRGMTASKRLTKRCTRTIYTLRSKIAGERGVKPHKESSIMKKIILAVAALILTIHDNSTTRQLGNSVTS